MKTYFKILGITLGIQLFGFILAYLVDHVFLTNGSDSMLPFIIGGLFLLVSSILGILLPIIWCDSLKHKIVSIVLMPTNYTWLLLIILVVTFVMKIVQIFKNVPSNFG